MDAAQLRKILEGNGIDPATVEAIVAENEQATLDVGKLQPPTTAPESTPAVEMSLPEVPKRPETNTGMVEFKGKTIMVKMPTLEQITIIKRLSRTFGSAAQQPLTAERAVALMDRAVKATCAVVARPEDVETVEDLMLEGSKFEDLMPLIVAAMNELRRANKPLGTPIPSGASIETGQ